MARKPRAWYPYGTPGDFRGKGLGQARQTAEPASGKDLRSMPDPRTSAKDARAFITALFGNIAAAEHNLEIMFQQLSLQLALGTVACDDIYAYNRAAVAHYANVGMVLAIFEGPFTGTRDLGVYLPREPPPPKLIATRVSSTRSTDGRVTYDWAVDCGADGFVDIKMLRHVGPVCPEPTQPLGAFVPPQCVAHPLAAFGCALLIGVTGYVLYHLGDQVLALVRSLTDKDIEFLKAQSYWQQLKQDALRLQYQTKCEERLIAAHTRQHGGPPGVDAVKSIVAHCQGEASRAVPERERPDFSRWGRAGIYVVVFAGIGFTLYMWRRRSTGGASERYSIPPTAKTRAYRRSRGRITMDGALTLPEVDDSIPVVDVVDVTELETVHG